MRRTHAFTLVEMLMASSAALLIVGLIYTALIYYGRAWTRGEEGMERSRRSQEIMGLLKDEFERSSGEIQLADVPNDIIRKMEFDGDNVGLLTRPRTGFNAVNGYRNFSDTHPYFSTKYPYQEFWEMKSTPAGLVVALNPPVCRYPKAIPPPDVALLVPPWGASAAAIHIPIPFDQPVTEFIIIKKQTGGNVSTSIWAYYRKSRPNHKEGTLVRWTPVSGIVTVGGDMLTDFNFDVVFDWAFVSRRPPIRPADWAQMVKVLAEMKLGYGKSLLPSGQDPGFEASGILLQGP
jgi:hypothetical protein